MRDNPSIKATIPRTRPILDVSNLVMCVIRKVDTRELDTANKIRRMDSERRSGAREREKRENENKNAVAGKMKGSLIVLRYGTPTDCVIIDNADKYDWIIAVVWAGAR